ncbi:MAG: orotidine-5'-phosphate decarboxylase [Candidatus Thermoplasmatota archaeon]|nr:orotidine-5'-phosphate decarboxylase [Candidatus Thermoplasmatota archaeon]
MKHNLADRLLDAVDEKKNPSVVGLDPRLWRIPDHLKEDAKESTDDAFKAAGEAIFEFNKGIIDAVHDIVPSVKPQVAFYEKYGVEGIRAFKKTIEYAEDKGLIVIEDVKRNDIGSTAKAYASAHLGEVDMIDGNTVSFDGDIVTVNPYLGYDGIEPFVEVCGEYGKGIFVLDKTSNPSSSELQDLVTEDENKIYEVMADLISDWGEQLIGERGYSSVGAVVGATYPEEAEKLREIMENNLFLVPGYGSQGGTADEVIPCFNDDGYGAIVNSSRGIDYAYEDDDEFGPKEFDKASRKAALEMKDDIMKSLEKGEKVPDGW